MATQVQENFISILVVEDNPGDLFLLKETLSLTKLSFSSIFTASSAHEAISVLQNNEITVVLLDLSLPDSSGFNSYKQIQEFASTIPIIVLTGIADTELALDTLAGGAQDYLIKGEFDERLLAKSIQYSIERNRIRLSLSESNESYRNLFFNNPLPIFIWHLQSLKILEVNDIAQVEYGYSRDELLNMSVKDLRDPKEHSRIESFARDFMDSNIIKKSGIWEHRKKNGELIILDISSHKIDYKGNAAILAIHNNITEKVRLQEKLEEEKMMKQKEITEAMIQVQEKERYEMSTELHDNVNQQLTVAMMYIASAQQKNPDEGGLLKQASDFIMHCIEEIRNLSQTLVTPMIKHFGLSKAVEGLLDDISRVNAIQIDLIADTFFEDDIKYDFKLSVFRIVQELVNNALKHSKAKNITLELLRKENQIYLSIQDDGIGFDTNQQRKGIGLHNIISRSDLYNGIVNIHTEPGKGCAIEITFPIENALEK